MPVSNTNVELEKLEPEVGVAIDVDIEVHDDAEIKVRYGSARVELTVGVDYTLALGNDGEADEDKVWPTTFSVTLQQPGRDKIDELLALDDTETDAIYPRRFLENTTDFSELDAFLREKISREIDRIIWRFQAVSFDVDLVLSFRQQYTEDAAAIAAAAALIATNLADSIAAREGAEAAQLAADNSAADAFDYQVGAEAARDVAESYRDTASTHATTATTKAVEIAASEAAVDADRITVAADKAIVAADKATVATDKGIVAADKAIVAADKATVAADKALVIASENAAAGSATAAAASAAAAAASAASLTSVYTMKGAWDASAGTFPGAGVAQIGWVYRVSVAGTVNSQFFSVGDSIVAIANNASTATFANNWIRGEGALTSAEIVTALGFTPVTNARNVSTSGLATGGGALSADRTIDVAAAVEADIATGTSVAKATTPKAVADFFATKDALAMHLAGTEAVTGNKTFSDVALWLANVHAAGFAARLRYNDALASANHIMQFDLNGANRILSMTGNLNLLATTTLNGGNHSGTNTGDQTIPTAGAGLSGTTTFTVNTNNAEGVGSYAILQNVSGAGVASGGTVAAASLLRVNWTAAGAIEIGTAPTGTWRNVGIALSSTDVGIFIRTA